MCDINCIRWAANNIKKEEIHNKRIIEVGSYDVNGSMRPIIQLLDPSEYIGVDIVEGPGVDVICQGENLVERFGLNSFDFIICTCVLEHTKEWKIVVSQLKKICKQGGIILIIVPSLWPFHEFPGDYWRYSKEDINNIFSDCEILSLFEDSTTPSLVYAKIRKKENFNEEDISQYKLYSIVTNTKINEIQKKDFCTWYFRKLVFFANIKSILIKVGKYIFSKM